ncbi:uncharacterized protein LOC123910853 isoform X1 [Trifolium pratense]|uniref:uncharacterized protein LOC123910853 isoform X1 n=1 Tax=Trifolium pratense TaxID=57577 RepID=UPI001E6948E1|nr:uncharacterized protein LOC123910853 isoform X1 [Trifolium pratense]
MRLLITTVVVNKRENAPLLLIQNKLKKRSPTNLRRTCQIQMNKTFQGLVLLSIQITHSILTASKMERQKATWNYGVGYGADYFTTCNGVRNQSASIFPQFVPNQSAPIFPQFHPYQSSPIFPQFPPVDNNFIRQSRTHDFPRYTRFMEEVENSAKMAG